MLLLITIACILLARVTYLETRYVNLDRGGATIFYDWQNPTIRSAGRIRIGFRDQAIDKTEYQIVCKANPRTWAGILKSAFIGDKAVAISIRADSLNPDLIDEIKSISTLENILLIESKQLADPFALPTLDRSEQLETNKHLSRSEYANMLNWLNVRWRTTYIGPPAKDAG